MEKDNLVVDHMIILQMSVTVVITHHHFGIVGNMNAFHQVDPTIGHYPLHTDTSCHHQTLRDYLLDTQVTGMMRGGQEHRLILSMAHHCLTRFLPPCWMR